MLNNNKFFYSAIFFSVGIFLASLGISLSILMALSLLVVVIFLFFYILKKDNQILWFSTLSLAIILGGSFYKFDEQKLAERYITNLPANL